jgi:diguanylate cyclase (GGDEF)-like protein
MNYDQLTKLPNRELLKVQGSYVTSQAAQNDTNVGLIYIGLDRFKYLNDSFGQLAGDGVLIELVRRLEKVIKPGDIIARVVGDEFAIVVTDTSEDDVAKLAKSINASISKPFTIDTESVVLTSSIGISLYPEDSSDFETLFQHANTAMENVKEEGRNDLLFFSQDMQVRTSRALKIDTALREALQNKELYLHYQPQVDMKTQQVIGVEALIRWQHPVLGQISPAEFIPQAEANGLIITC